MTDARDRTAAPPVYWRSLDQLADAPRFRELVEREFAEGAAEGPGLSDPVSRRRFLGVVAASVAAASLTGCRKPTRNILPFNQRPAGMVPGIPRFYATSYDAGGYGVGMLVRSNDGRPTKIEGNPLHPSSVGGADAFMQGDLLNLYDPGRSKHVLKDGSSVAAAALHAEAGGHGAADGEGESRQLGLSDFRAFWDEHVLELVAARGAGLRLLVPPTTSPSIQAKLQELRSVMPQAVVHTFAPVDRDQEIAGAKLAFGRAVDADLDLGQADVVVSFDHDFLSTDGAVVRNARAWAKRRKIEAAPGSVARLYVAEASYTVTGSNADHRFRMPSGQIAAAVFALAVELGVGDDDPELAKALAPHKGAEFRYRGKNWIGPVAADLKRQVGRSCVTVGPRQPAVVHAVAHAINLKLGNVGKTVAYRATAAGIDRPNGVESVRELVTAMSAGQVGTLICLDSNPVYTAPADLDFTTALGKVRHRIHLGGYVDETALLCNWHVNMAHGLEAWGDLLAHDGTPGIVQPLVAPLFFGVSVLEFLAHLLTADVTEGYAIVKEHWRQKAQTDDSESWWNQALEQGVIGTAAPTVTLPAFLGDAVARAIAAHASRPAPTATSLEVNIRLDATMLDGRFSNNPWMLEVSDPITKLAWDNAAQLSPATATALGVENGDVVRIAAGGRSVAAPAWVVPGHADGCVTVTLGWGRQMAAECRMARGAGFDAYRLRTTEHMHIVPGAVAEPTGAHYQLVSTQEHGSMEGRPVVREDTLDGFRKNPDFAPAESPLAQTARLETAVDRAAGHDETITEQDLLKSLWQERDYSEGYQWGMVIDLNSCIGCNACVVACIAENNIPMVGKQQVASGRDMHWVRIDRYFKGDEEPQIVHQMVPCMHCENAPCESVCPVNATTHSPEGLNDMVYNRCIGTRYCANNCPYKVRRFNWLDFHGTVPKTVQMAYNPDVTVRVRGVMEKCTYCVQRITAGKLHAKLDGRKVRDGEIVPACAQTCPTEAITFGDKNDPTTRVAQLKRSDLDYAMLSELNVKPRTTYLAKIRNPNPELS